MGAWVSAALFTAAMDGAYPGEMLGMYFDAQAVLRSYDYGAARVLHGISGSVFFSNGEVTVGRKYHDHDWGARVRRGVAYVDNDICPMNTLYCTSPQI